MTFGKVSGLQPKMQEENWTDSVHNHDNEHAAAWLISMRFVCD